MRVTPTKIEDVLLVEPKILSDERGSFHESFSVERYRSAGIPGRFVQDNVSVSRRGVLRGLHLQHPHGQGKLVEVVRGEVFDVAVDVRIGSPTFGKWVGEHLSAENSRQIYIPAGFAHGFLALSDEAVFVYKCTDYHHQEAELTIRWNDPAIGIEWPSAPATLSARDSVAPLLSAIDPSRLPRH